MIPSQAAAGLLLSALLLMPAAWGLDKAPRFHDPSTPILEGDTWAVFSTGNGIITRYSRDLKTWVTGEPVFKDFPAWHREVVPNQKGYLWAPDISFYGRVQSALKQWDGFGGVPVTLAVIGASQLLALCQCKRGR